MENTKAISHEKKTFYVIGLNYRKADIQTRGLFSINRAAQTAMLLEAKDSEIWALSVLSTCNRTELYGISSNPFQLIKLLCKYTKGSLEDFDKWGYVYKAEQAVRHIFRVGTGLDSQILGDFEIISQLRSCFKRAKEEEMLNTYMERLINSVIQASKRIKNETALSSGAASVSFAAVRYIRAHVQQVFRKKIVLFGTGKIGRNTVENLVKHMAQAELVLINRTRKKAEDIGMKFNLVVKDFEALETEVKGADVLIVATGSPVPTLTQAHLKGRKKPLLILDLSVPENVASDVEQLPGVCRIDLDTLSRLTQDTLNRRKAEVPKAEAIIEEIQQEFLDWVHIRQFAPTIRALKERFNRIKADEIAYQSKKIKDFNAAQAEVLGDRIIQKILTQFASHLRAHDQAMEERLEMITQVFHLDLKE